MKRDEETRYKLAWISEMSARRDVRDLPNILKPVEELRDRRNRAFSSK